MLGDAVAAVEALFNDARRAVAGRVTVEGRVASRLFDSALLIRRTIGDQAGVTETLTSLASIRLAEGHHEAARADASANREGALLLVLHHHSSLESVTTTPGRRGATP